MQAAKPTQADLDALENFDLFAKVAPVAVDVAQCIANGTRLNTDNWACVNLDSPTVVVPLAW